MLTSDRDLLREIARARSAEAFAVIVERYLALVHAAARRQVGDARAEDVTQAVFLLLWQRPSRVRDGAVLAGWLVNATRLTSMQALRADRRRRRREHFAAAEHSRDASSLAGDSVNSHPDELSPVLDDVLGRLGATERTAVTLRYLQDKPLSEVATTLGISEAAAAKRVSRGIGHLRRELAKRGVSMPLASVGAAMLRVSSNSSSLDASKIALNATAGGEAGATLAKAVATAMTIQKRMAAAVVVTVIAAVIGGAMWCAPGFFGGRPMHPSAQANPQSAGVTASAGAPGQSPIKVGLIVSNATAVAQSPMGRPWGFQVQTRMAKELHAADIELYAVIEPGTADAEGMQQEVQQVFAGRPPIDGGDVEAIKRLNVIVSNENWVTDAQLLKSLDAAVSDGVGLVNNGGIGSAQPGINAEANDGHAELLRLAGLREGWFGQTPTGVPCQVMVDHPILGGLRAEAQVLLRCNGVYGVMPNDAVPLIKVIDNSVVPKYGNRADDAQLCTFYPIYLSTLGKGKIISVQFAPWHRATPPPAQLAPKSTLYLRCVRWLVNRPVE